MNESHKLELFLVYLPHDLESGLEEHASCKYVSLALAAHLINPDHRFRPLMLRPFDSFVLDRVRVSGGIIQRCCNCFQYPGIRKHLAAGRLFRLTRMEVAEFMH